VSKQNKHIIRTIESEVEISALPESVWDNITNVKIEQFSDPLIFRLIDIPKPLRAEVISEGEGGSRIAYFNTGKRFLQKILVWKPYAEYSFSFNPEKGFTVCYLLDISEGFFQIPSGAYFLSSNGKTTTLRLKTTYSIDKRVYLLLNLPARLILKLFQRYLLTSIKKNSE
jgi:hypothetical protein